MPLETAAMLAYEEGLSALLAGLDTSLFADSRPVTTRARKADKR